MPFWIWIVFAGIVVCAVMSILTARQDRKVDNQWIEDEGEKYMERLRVEREKRLQEKG